MNVWEMEAVALTTKQLRKLFEFDNCFIYYVDQLEYHGGYVMGRTLAILCLLKFVCILMDSLIRNGDVKSSGYPDRPLQLPKYDRPFHQYFDSDITPSSYNEIMELQFTSVMRGYGWDVYITDLVGLNDRADELGTDDVEAVLSDYFKQIGFPAKAAGKIAQCETLQEMFVCGEDISRVKLYTHKGLSRYLKEHGKDIDYLPENMKRLVLEISELNVYDMSGDDSNFWCGDDFYFLEILQDYYLEDTWACYAAGDYSTDFSHVADLAELSELLEKQL